MGGLRLKSTTAKLNAPSALDGRRSDVCRVRDNGVSSKNNIDPEPIVVSPVQGKEILEIFIAQQVGMLRDNTSRKNGADDGPYGRCTSK